MVYDACAIVAVLFAEPLGRDVGKALDRDGSPSVSACNFSEVLVQIGKKTGRCAWPEGFERPNVIPVDVGIAETAAALYFETRVNLKRDGKLSLADCTALATALALRTKVVTTDARFAAFGSPAVTLIR